MKKSSVELWIQNIEEIGFLEPAILQRTNDDNDGRQRLRIYFLS